jgi:hypothetical protein
MKKLFIALSMLAACATSNQPRGAHPRQNRIDPAPAIQLLQATRFEEAEAKAREILASEPPNAQANAVAAITVYKRILHQLVQDAISIAMGAAQSHRVNYQYLSYALTNADEGLTAVEKHLAVAGNDSNFALELCLACWRYDWNHNGRIDWRDEALFQIEEDAEGRRIPEEDPRRKPTFRFDLGDVHWARAMVMFQHAALNIVMAYDFSDLDKLILMDHHREDKPQSFNLRLKDKGRIQQAKALILDGLAAAKLARKLYQAETDDVNEWVPNPRQQNHPLPLPVDEALYETWGQILADLVRLVQGQEGLSIAELAQLGDHRWQSPPRGYLNLGRLLDEPADIVFYTSTFEELDRMRGEPPMLIERILHEVFGEKYGMSMKPSPLLGRLQRMKREIEHGQESLERKLRYLIWLN